MSFCQKSLCDIVSGVKLVDAIASSFLFSPGAVQSESLGCRYLKTFNIQCFTSLMCVTVSNKAFMCTCLHREADRGRGGEGMCDENRESVCDLASLRDSLQRTVMTGRISEATQTRENSILCLSLSSCFV